MRIPEAFWQEFRLVLRLCEGQLLRMFLYLACQGCCWVLYGIMTLICQHRRLELTVQDLSFQLGVGHK